MTSLITPLPESLEWLTDRVQSLIKPAAFMVPCKARAARLGCTFIGGLPDVPALWTHGHTDNWNQSPYDGKSHWLQLNLADIPEAVRRPEWPTYGMVWVVIDLSTNWRADVLFDSRPSEQISWATRAVNSTPKAVDFVLRETLPWATPETLPEICWGGGETDFSAEYDNWMCKHYADRRPSRVQVGGWAFTCQGDFDEQNRTIVVAFNRQEFGDSGGVYLHYDSERGFFAHVDTH